MCKNSALQISKYGVDTLAAVDDDNDGGDNHCASFRHARVLH